MGRGAARVGGDLPSGELALGQGKKKQRAGRSDRPEPIHPRNGLTAVSHLGAFGLVVVSLSFLTPNACASRNSLPCQNVRCAATTTADPKLCRWLPPASAHSGSSFQHSTAPHPSPGAVTYPQPRYPYPVYGPSLLGAWRVPSCLAGGSNIPAGEFACGVILARHLVWWADCRWTDWTMQPPIEAAGQHDVQCTISRGNTITTRHRSRITDHAPKMRHPSRRTPSECAWECEWVSRAGKLGYCSVLRMQQAAGELWRALHGCVSRIRPPAAV
jgi:hypothetical protein